MRNYQPHFHQVRKLLIPLLLSVSACSSDNGSPGTDIATSSTPTILEGTWLKACGIGDGIEPTDPVFYDEITLTFEGNQGDSVIKNFSDANCTLPYFVSPVVTAKGVFTIGEEIISSSGLTVKKIDDHVTEYQGAPFDINTFDILYINPNNTDELLFGDDSTGLDGLSDATRPTALNFDRVYTRR